MTLEITTLFDETVDKTPTVCFLLPLKIACISYCQALQYLFGPCEMLYKNNASLDYNHAALSEDWSGWTLFLRLHMVPSVKKIKIGSGPKIVCIPARDQYLWLSKEEKRLPFISSTTPTHLILPHWRAVLTRAALVNGFDKIVVVLFLFEVRVLHLWPCSSWVSGCCPWCWWAQCVAYSWGKSSYCLPISSTNIANERWVDDRLKPF